MSEQRLKQVNPPTFNFKESDLLVLQQTVKQLVSANNNHHDIIKEVETSLKEKVIQSHIMCQVILKILVDKGLTTVEEVDDLTRQAQTKDSGYVKKKGPAKSGDLLLISFMLYDSAGELVEDRSKEVLAYNLGSGGLPCDAQLEGIVERETRHLTVVFGENFTHKHLIGHELMLHLTCHDVQVKA
jgi:hypothetical protein